MLKVENFTFYEENDKARFLSSKNFMILVPLTEVRRQRIALEDAENRRTSSRGLIPKAKVKTIKMTFVIIFGKKTTTTTTEKHPLVVSWFLSLFQNPSNTGFHKNLFSLLLVLVFVLCWSPYIVFDLLQVKSRI